MLWGLGGVMSSTRQKGPGLIAKQSGPGGISHTAHNVSIMEIVNPGMREETRHVGMKLSEPGP